VTVTANTTAELREQRDAVGDADLIELRLDSVRDPDVAGALAGRRRPVVITCRPTWEGGMFGGSEPERKSLLSEAIRLGAEYVDIEWRARFDDLIAHTSGRGIVLSMHDFGGVPADLSAQVRAMRATGAEVVKIAAQTERLADCVPLLDLAARTAQEKLVVIGMGDHGIATRILAARFGSLWTYAGALREVGQLSAPSLLEDFHFRSLSDATRVYGIVGGSVAHSVSPAMHNAAFRAAHIDAVYLPLPAVDADDVVMFGKAVGISGASVTIPHKVTLCDRVDEVSPVARRIGAINTIRVTDGRWIGGNTDARGFLQPLQDAVDLKSTRASVLGAGGASRAVAVALSSSGCSVRVHARQTRQAQDIAAISGGQLGAWPPEPGSWDLLVNCTPVGMHPRVDESPIRADLLTGGIVYDLVYNPPTTRLLREASARGCRTIGGLDMLVAQAEEQFHWWTDTKPAAGVMREAALKRLAEFARDEDHVV